MLHYLAHSSWLLKAPWPFEMSGTTHPMMQCHISECLLLNLYFYDKIVWTGRTVWNRMCAAHITEVCCIKVLLSFCLFSPRYWGVPPVLSHWFSSSLAVVKVKHFLALSLLTVHSIYWHISNSRTISNSSCGCCGGGSCRFVTYGTACCMCEVWTSPK
jgi:hypothetical protein